MSKPNSTSCNGQLNSGSLHKQTRKNSLSRDVRSPVEDHDMVSSLSHNINSQTHSGCLNVMADLLSRSNQVQSTEWSLHPQVFKQICQKWFTPHVDLFVTHLNHKLQLYLSPVPDPKAWDIDALNINWTGLTAYAYPPTALLHRGIQNQAMSLPDHCNSPRLARDALVLGPSAALNRDPSATSGVNNSAQTVPQLFVPQQSTTSQPPRLVSRVDSSKNKASLWRWQRELLPLRGHQQGPSTNQSGPYLRNGIEKIWGISPLHL